MVVVTDHALLPAECNLLSRAAHERWWPIGEPFIDRAHLSELEDWLDGRKQLADCQWFTRLYSRLCEFGPRRVILSITNQRLLGEAEAVACLCHELECLLAVPVTQIN